MTARDTRTGLGTEHGKDLLAAVPRLSAKETAAAYKRIILNNEHRLGLCAVVCPCGPSGEPLACGYQRDHRGPHSWGTLPTFVDGEVEVLGHIRQAWQDFDQKALDRLLRKADDGA